MRDKSPLTLRLSLNQLSGPHQLIFTKTQIKRIQKAMKNETGSDIKKYRNHRSKIISIGKGLQVDKSRNKRSFPIYVPKKLPTIPFRGGNNMLIIHI